jgi:hypothetical protein
MSVESRRLYQLYSSQQLPKALINSWKLQTKGKDLLDYQYNLKEKLPMTKRLLVDWQLATGKTYPYKNSW